MGRHFRLTYFLRPYLHDYIVHRFGRGDAPLNPSIRSEEHPLVLWINCTAGRRRTDRTDRVGHSAFAQGRKPYTILITARRARRHGHGVDMQGQRDFERLVYQQLMHELIAHINAHRRHRVHTIASIIDFMLANGISPDSIDAEDLRRVAGKVGKRREDQLFAPTVPTGNPPPPAPSSAP